MRRLILPLFLLSSCFFGAKALAQKAVLIEDEAVQVGKKIEKIESRRGSFLREKKSIQEVFNSEYDSTYSMRADRRVGIGMEVAGKLGLIGANAELNFALDDSALIGFGGGPQYSSFQMGWRHVFNGRSVAPFVGAAFSHWYNSSGSGGYLSGSTPNFLADKFLTDEEKQTGKFAVNLLVPSAGLQYNMLSGPYVGTSLYVEAMALLNLSNLQNVLNGCFGAIYYF